MISRRISTPASAGQPRSEVRRRSQESGYAYLMALFLVLVMLALSQEVMQNMVTQGRRAREEDMIWRGNQYARAIRLYYRKTGHYPQSLEDLQNGLPELHFLRYAAYKDPMNKSEDGAWRLIWVNATGQIIGSVRYATLQQMAVMDLNGGKIPTGALPGSLGVPVSSMTSGTGGAGNQSAQTTPPGGNASGQAPPGSTPDSSSGGAQNPAPAQPSSSSSDQPVNPLSLLKPTGKVDGPVLGAFLTGVGGGTKSDTPSVRVYNGGKNYGDWEFIWNPLEDQARAVQQGLSPLGQPTGQIGAPTGIGSPNPVGTPPGFGGTIMPPPSQPQPQNR